MSASQWVILAILCGVIEIFTVGFWFLGLALAALLVAIGASLGWLITLLPAQLLVFAVISLLFIVFTRPMVIKLIKSKDTVSNVNALIGQHGIVTQNIKPFSYGQVKVNGEIWTAMSEQEIENDTRVKVLAVDGVKLVVAIADESPRE